MEHGRRYSKEVKGRAGRMVLEHEENYSSQWAAISSIAPKNRKYSTCGVGTDVL
jgi:transposase